MKVIVSSFTRFHMYNQSSQLDRHGVLKCLITNYPRNYVKTFGIDSEKIVSVIFTGLLYRVLKLIYGYLKIEMSSNLKRYLHNKYSKSVEVKIFKESDFFIGLSSFSLEGIIKSNNLGIITIVDHGSINLEIEKIILMEEYDKFSIDKKYMTQASDWIVKKENKEFLEADYILLGSHFAKETFIKKGFDSNKLLVNNYGVDLKDFKKIDKIDNVFRIIYCGGFTLGKGLHYLLKVFNDLKLKNSELWLIGSSSILDKALLSVIEKLDINFENIYLKGHFSQKELYKLYSQGTIFVLPSLSDGFGMVVPQALACGLPVILTENTGARDIITNYVNGFIIPSGQFNELKKKIVYFYENEDKTKKMSINAINSVSKGLEWNDYGDRLKEILDVIFKKNRIFE